METKERNETVGNQYCFISKESKRWIKEEKRKFRRVKERKEMRTHLMKKRWTRVETRRRDELEANFESEPYTVQTLEGSEVNVRSKEGVEYSGTVHLLSGTTHQRNFRKARRPLLKKHPILFHWRRI